MVSQLSISTQACQQPDCDGSLSDGYCDCCGMAAASAADSGRASPLGIAQTAVSSNLFGQQSALFSQELAELRSLPLSRSSSAPVLADASQSITSSITSPSKPGSAQSSSQRLSQRSSPHSSRRSDRSSLGFGLVSLPELPSTQPESLVLEHPEVPVNKRFCGHCDASVRREQGFCSQCGSRYSFVPSLAPGMVVAEQYEVKGAIAYGGLGWIYLAFDQLLSRYVVLKGLLNSEDASSAAVALAERQFLAAVKHPNIVSVYNFVTHDSQNQGGEGFIVMEYVAGKTIRDLRRERGPLPVAEAIAYIHRILKPFGYLHQQGLVYCDFKPDNMMLEGGDVKLIDLGAVRRLDDPAGDIYGTVGYSAPESGQGPTMVSDLFTVGRTLAVLVATIPEFGQTHQFSLPGPDQIPLFGKYQSLYRFLLRATAFEPAERFQSAEEMAEQLLGVLRQVLALEAGTLATAPRASIQDLSTNSQQFGSDPLALALPQSDWELTARGTVLPPQLSDSGDPAYVEVMHALALPEQVQRLAQLSQIVIQQPDSLAAQLGQIRCSIEELHRLQGEITASSFEQLEQHWRSLSDLHPNPSAAERCRIAWLKGQFHLLRFGAMPEELEPAQRAFEQVYQQLPGELAPQLALAVVHELRQDWAIAQEFYYRVWQTDHNQVTAALGLVRCCLHQAAVTAAVQVLSQVPATAPLYGHIRQQMVYLLLDPASAVKQMTGIMPEAAAQTVDQTAAQVAQVSISPSEPTIADLELASQLIQALPSDRQLLFSQQLFRTAWSQLQAGQLKADPKHQLLQRPREVNAMRAGLEQSLRRLARTHQGKARVQWVEQANVVRSRTWF